MIHTQSDLLKLFYDTDFSEYTGRPIFVLLDHFKSRRFSVDDLSRVFDFLQQQSVNVIDKKGKPHSIPAVFQVGKKNNNEKPLMVMAGLHGNEVAGLASFLLLMALDQAGFLNKPVYAAAGSPYAISQYFSSWKQDSTSPQYMRDSYRGGVNKNGGLLPDPNRVPADLMISKSNAEHIKRAKQLVYLAGNASGVIDLHTARGDMCCVTEYTDPKLLQYSPIRVFLTGLLEGIGNYNGSNITLDEYLMRKYPDIPMIGIEAGTHEDPAAPLKASMFVFNMLPHFQCVLPEKLHDHLHDSGRFTEYKVRNRLSFANLEKTGAVTLDDLVYSARRYQCGEVIAGNDRVLVKVKDPEGLKVVPYNEVSSDDEIAYVVHQYSEMERVKKRPITGCFCSVWDRILSSF